MVGQGWFVTVRNISDIYSIDMISLRIFTSVHEVICKSVQGKWHIMVFLLVC
jgi:hypothetical protein